MIGAAVAIRSSLSGLLHHCGTNPQHMRTRRILSALIGPRCLLTVPANASAGGIPGAICVTVQRRTDL